jgi:NADH dehydrogenase
MQEVPGSLAEFAERELRRRVIEVCTQTTLENVTESSAPLSGGEEVAARTVVWTAGVKPSPVVAHLGLPLEEQGRILVDRYMAVTSSAGQQGASVWAIGDCAAVPNPARPGQPCPPTAQHAIRQGRLAARNVPATLAGGRPKPFRYWTKGVVAELGRNQAVAITLGIGWRGRPAWLMARTYHLLLMPGFGRRLRLLLDWNVALLFGRDAS